MSVASKFHIDKRGLIYIELLYWVYKFLLLQDLNRVLKLIGCCYLCSIMNVYISWQCHVNLQC